MRPIHAAWTFAFLIALTGALQAGPPAGAPLPNDNLKTVTVEGRGMSKDEALRDAKRKAVEEGAGSYIHSQSEVEDFVLVRDTILARATGFVQEVRILSTSTEADGVVYVKIRAVVSVRGVQDVWGTVTNLLQTRGEPKVMVFITENIDKVTYQSGASIRTEKEVQDLSTVQSSIEQLLLKSGFQLVDRNAIKEVDRRKLEAAIAENNPARIQNIAQSFGAHLFITGVANANHGGMRNLYGRNYHTYEAEANVRCYRADTAQLLSSVPGSGTRGVQEVWRTAAKQALEQQGQTVAPQVQGDILRFWLDVLQGRGEIVLEIADVSFTQYLKIKKALEALDGVESVNSEYNNKIVTSSIKSDMTAEQLAEKIVGSVEGVEITGLSKNTISGKWTGE